MVRARLAGGGASKEENKLCAAEAVTGGGGAIEPLRAADREDCPAAPGLPGIPKKAPDAGLVGVFPFAACLAAAWSWESRSNSVLLVELFLTLKLAYERRARKLRAS